MNWNARLEVHPIETPAGATLRTLADCRAYILALPKAEQTEARWQAATAELLKAAEHGGPFLMIARIMVAKAIHGDAPAAPIGTATDRRSTTFKTKRAAFRAKKIEKKR